MKTPIILLALCLCSASILNAQHKSLKSGPWAGNVELRNATIWAEVSSSAKTIAVKYYPQANPKEGRTVAYTGVTGNEFNPVKIELNGLDINTAYAYQLLINNEPVRTSFATTFTTKDLWQYRKPAPDFSFLAGSCAYFNEPLYDRPGTPYGADSSIFETMAKTPAAFHIWMGDNWYTREVDFYTSWGLNYRASRDRGQKVLQEFMAKMPQYAIWDDHDYGPNDAGGSFILKAESREIFKNYTVNPSYGQDGKGIYTKVSYSDVDIFLTDDRYFRSEIEVADSINGSPNTAKTFFGEVQMDWLKNELLYSRATFKVIVVGSQVLNQLNPYECMQHYKSEYRELLNFISSQTINGILFFSGDRHHSEVIRMPREGLYTLYDVTMSPYTAGVSKVRGTELTNPDRISNTLVEQQNFGRISVSGNKNERMMKVEFIGITGSKLGEWSILETELKVPKK